MKGADSINGSSGNFEIAQSNQDLISDKGLGRKKRAIMLASGAFILIVIALIITAIVLFTDSIEAASLKRDSASLSLDDVLYGAFSPKQFNGTWVSDSEILYRNDDILVFNVNTLKSKVILPATAPVLAGALQYFLSADRKYMLIEHDLRKLFRYSYVAQYTIVELATQKTTPLNANGEVVLQLAIWGPVGNSIVFVARNNIFYRDSVESNDVKQLTADGLIGNTYNGIPDWVYEEEVFASKKALWISPDGRKLAYAKFADTFVKVMTIPVYGEPGSLDFQYTRAVQVRYPKPGTPNPIVSLHVIDLKADSEILNLDPPSNLIKQEPVLATVTWATNDTVCAIWTNRVQNEASILVYATEIPYRREIIKTIIQEGGWLELFKPPIFSRDGSKMIMILSQNQGNDVGSYKHVTLLERQPNKKETALTRGRYVVTEILGWDENTNIVYFQATGVNDSASQHIYSVSTKTGETTCLSCSERTSTNNSRCSYNTAEFSIKLSNYVLNCEGPNVPETILISKNKRHVVWENNQDLNSIVSSKNLPLVEKYTFDVADGFKANVMLKLPHQLDRSGNTKYPMLVNVYGGPDSYQVVDKYNVDWGSYLAANKSIIYATIDGRGSGLRGDKLLFSLYRKLGTIEIADQINVTKQIQEKLPFVDPGRTAIWGWSYGGFASGMALATDVEGIFKCGISVAPVTDWTLYDSLYTERFMGLPTPEDNLKGYKNAQLITRFQGIRDKFYFLVHGTLDDNVHYQQSMLWARILEQQDIMFRQMTYADEDHSLASVQPHLYHTLENFLDECFINENDVDD